MTTKHTPGPWRHYAFEESTIAFVVDNEETTVVKLSVTQNTTAHSALPSNALLIAAAPDLLAALQLVYANAGESPEWLRARIGPAIARATGA
jgi:hypothetical protein